MNRKWLQTFARLEWLVVNLGVALFVLRVSLESNPLLWRWSVAAALACAAAGYLAHIASLRLTPLALLWLYVVWPLASPTMAWSVGFVALFGLIIGQIGWSKRSAAIMDVSILVLSLALYVATLAPTILPADGGEFQIVGSVLGVAHPPGYAMFTLLAWLFSRLPFGEVAWRMNLMGAVTGALTLVIVSRTARRIARTPWAGLLAASALGFSTTFWAQSTTINIRALIMLFMALSCYFVAKLIAAPIGSQESRRALTGLALSFGAGTAHHTSLAFFAPLLGIVILWHDPGMLRRARDWLRYLIAFLIPFAFNLYIVLRAITGAPFGTDNLVDTRRVLDHLLMRGFSGDMFAYLTPNRFLWERFMMVGNILDFQFGPILLIISAIGFAWLIWREKKLAFLLGSVFTMMAFIVATYRAPQSVEYLMPAYIPIALCIGCAVAWFAPPLDLPAFHPSRRLSNLLTAVILLAILSLGQTNLPSYLQLHDDRSAREYAASVLLDAPPNAHILASWHWATPLWYLQLVEGRRPDVTVEYVPPQGATPMPYAWPKLIAERLAVSGRPLIVTNYYSTYIDLPYHFEPIGKAFLVRDKPVLEIPPNLVRLDADLDRKIRILGYRIGKTSLHPGEWVTVDLVWQPLVHLERDYSFSVQLLGPNDVPAGQDDRRHHAAPSYEPGEVLTDHYEFPVFLTAAPGQYRLIAGVYLTFADGSWQRLKTAEGQDAISLFTVSVVPSSLPPVTCHSSYKAFIGGPTLVGVDYDDTLPEGRRVSLHWQIGRSDVVVQLYAGDQVVAQNTISGSQENGYVTTALDAPAGSDDLSLVLLTPDTGVALERQEAWGLVRAGALSLPRPRPRQHYLPFGGKTALIHVDIQEDWKAGQQARIALHWLGLQPIVHDYVVSVSVHGPNIVVPSSDWVPALGAIPTFKWVRGSLITDVHLVDLPTDARGEAEVSVGIYDAFVNTRALVPLDERIARMGRLTVPIERVNIK